MERKILTILSAILTATMLLTIVLLLGIDDIHTKSESLAFNMQLKRQYRQTLRDIMQDEKANESELQSFADKGQLRIALPQDTGEDNIHYTEDIIKRTVGVIIDGIDDTYFDSDPILGSVNNINDFNAYEDEGRAYLDITLNNIYEVSHLIEDNYLYLNFLDPHDVYPYVVVIDAGHGGSDVGAVEGDYYEKTIDLDIVLKLKELIDQDPDIKAYYTRLDDYDISLKDRVSLSNDVNADVFLSVHNNSLSGFGAKNTSGTQVLYYASDISGLSMRFANICLDKLCGYLNSTNRGLVNGDDIYIVHNSKAPVALVEIGFLSNQEDLNKLNNDIYRRRCAKALYDSIREMLTYKE